MSFTITQGIQDILDKYKKSALDIVRDFNDENGTKNDYQKREIFELLQNADDEANNGKEVVVKFSLTGNTLKIQNTGNPFLEENIGCLMYPRTSNKSLRKNTIGNKGLGFRAVLNWADTVRIITKQFAVEFSKKYAVEQITKILNNAELNNVVKSKLGNILPATIFAYPKIIPTAESEFATTIELVCSAEHIKTIIDDLNSLDFRELLFLSNISQIKIDIEGQKERIVERIKINNEIIISDNYNENAETGIWKIYKSKGTVRDKEYEFIIARNSDEKIQKKLRENGVLYSYFKVKGIAMPFPFLVHGTFELTSDRNLLQESSKYNHELINRLARFIGETAIKVSNENKDYDYKPLSLMIPSNINMGILDNNFNFRDTLASLVNELALFPTINSDKPYISMAENPKFSKEPFADNCLNPKVFTNLLKGCNDEIIVNYMLNKCRIGFYTENELADLINNDLEYYDLKKKNELIKLCIEQFNPYSYTHKEFIYPNLVIGKDGKPAKSRVFNNPSDADNYEDLPSWVDFAFINKEQESQLKDLFNIKDTNVFVNKLKDFGLINFRLDSIVGQLFTQAKESNEKTREVIKWLYHYWQSNNQQFGTSFTNVEPKAISRSGKIVNCSKLFFGKEYNNIAGENIIVFLKDVEFIADIKELGLETEDIETVKMFFSQLEVKMFPQIQVQSLSSQQISEYIKYNSKRYVNLKTQYNEIYSHADFFSQWQKDIKVANIENLTTILEKASFSHILTWILNDKNLYNHIIESNEIDDTAVMIGKPARMPNERKVYKAQMSSWLHKQFKEIDWIKTKSGKKTNTYNCTIDENKLSPILEVVDINFKAYDRLKRNDIERLLVGLEIANDVSDLSKEKIYEILLNLPEIDKNHYIGRQIYTKLNLSKKIEDGSVDELVTDNENYAKFKKNGKVLSKQNGVLEYRTANEVYYVDKKTYSEDILSKHPLLELQRRAGATKIQKMFFVKDIKTIGEPKVIWTEHKRNQEYSEWYKKLLPYIYAKRMNADFKNKELNLLKKSKLILVQNAETEYKVGSKIYKGILKDFELVYANKTAYIKLPENIDTIRQMRSEPKFCSAVAEMLTTLLDVDSDRDFFRLILARQSLREIEENDFDNDLTVLVLAKSKFKKEIDYKAEFWQTIANIKRFENADKLIDEYENYLSTNFDYDDINTKKNAENIINLFSKLNIDIDEYNELAEPIDLTEFLISSFIEFRQSLREKYLCYIYENKTNEFEKLKQNYDCEIPIIKNSIKTNIRQIYEDMFNVKIANLETQIIFDWQKEFQQSIKNEIIVENSATQDQKVQKVEVDYIALNEQIKQGENNSFSEVEIEKPENLNNFSKKGSGRNHGIYDKESDSVKDKNGFIAESKVYHTLKKKYGKTGSVVWVSGNGEKAGETTSGDDTLGYDIKYTDKKGKLHYVEVKATSGDNIEFTLSRNEFIFAQENKVNYKVFFVFIKNEVAQEPKDLKNIFLLDDNEDVYSNSKFSIEQSEFKIRAKIKK